MSKTILKPAIWEQIIESDMCTSENEFTVLDAADLLDGELQSSISNALGKLATAGKLSKRIETHSGLRIAYYKKSTPPPEPVPPTIGQRILASKLYLSGNKFSSAVMLAHLKGASKGGVNNAINNLLASRELNFVEKATSGKGVGENIYIKANKNTGWLKMAWVKTPTSSADSPVWS